MYDFLNALNDFRDYDDVRERGMGTFMDVVIKSTRSKIGDAFSNGRKVPARLKTETRERQAG